VSEIPSAEGGEKKKIKHQGEKQGAVKGDKKEEDGNGKSTSRRGKKNWDTIPPSPEPTTSAPDKPGKGVRKKGSGVLACFKEWWPQRTHVASAIQVRRT